MPKRAWRDMTLSEVASLRDLTMGTA
jgi:hypothetical protein